MSESAVLALIREQSTSRDESENSSSQRGGGGGSGCGPVRRELSSVGCTKPRYLIYILGNTHFHEVSSLNENDSWPAATRNAKNGGSLLPVVNLMTDSQSGSAAAYSRLMV